MNSLMRNIKNELERLQYSISKQEESVSGIEARLTDGENHLQILRKLSNQHHDIDVSALQKRIAFNIECDNSNYIDFNDKLKTSKATYANLQLILDKLSSVSTE